MEHSTPYQRTELDVTAIPLPWRHVHGTVVDIESPASRPKVVDLVLSNGLRTAETRGAVYANRRDGVWDLARFVAVTGRRA